MLCHFGPPTQGLSPYGDSLARALERDGGIDLTPVGYRAAYPGFLHPAAAGSSAGDAGLHWAEPSSWRRIAESPGDVLHIQHWLPALAAYLAPLASRARRQGKRVVVTAHNPEPHETLPGMRWLDRRLLDRADVIVVHDARGRDALIARLGAGRDIRVIPHGVELGEVSVRRPADDVTRLGLARDRRLVTLFGNLRGYKGVPVLLEAWGRIADRHPEVDLVVAGRLWSGRDSLPARLSARVLGTGQEAQRIRGALADPRLQGRVHLLEGFLPDAEVDVLLRSSALAVFPYERFASQSGAATRAGGLGCPLLVSDVGGLPELAIGRDWIVPPGDAAALAAALDARLVEGPRVDVRSRQREVLAQFAWPRVAATHVELYRSLSVG